MISHMPMQQTPIDSEAGAANTVGLRPPLVGSASLAIRLLFVGTRFRSTFPSDGPSRFRPWCFTRASPPSG